MDPGDERDALRTLGAHDPATSSAGFPTTATLLWSGTGKPLGAAEVSLTLEDGTTGYTLKRADLYRAMRDAAGSRGIQVEYGKRLAAARHMDGQISGLLRHQNVWVSSSSCYRTLKSKQLVWEWILREAPWTTAHYEPFRPNQIWGEDWTGIVIDGLRHYVLTLLDLFSRYLVAWGIFRTITQKHVKNLVALAIMSQSIGENETLNQY